MVRGIHTAAYAMIAERERLEVTANNIANSSTAGFRKDLITFVQGREMQMFRAGDGSYPLPYVGALGTGSFVLGVSVSQAPGSLIYTGNPLDVAVLGDGYFALSTPDGVRYTRNGAFSLDAQGRLVSQEGYTVFGREGVLRIEGEAEIGPDGQVMQGSTVVGWLAIYRFQDPSGLIKRGQTLFEPSAVSGPAVLTDGNVRVGFLESSNVNPMQEMVNLITIMRSYEACQRYLSVQDEMLSRAVNDVARV
ncbi:MAG: flagellar hook-basal body protein [Bacillota bacterium]